MENKLTLFQNEELGTIRVVEIDGQPWWVLKDVCEVLGLSNPSMIADRLDDDERAKLNLGRQGKANIINESGLYAVILRSDKPKAKAFRRWVTSEVLPSIRKYGAYATEEALKRALRQAEFERDMSSSMLDESMQRNKKLCDSVIVLTPKARYYDLILQNKGAMQVSIIAQDYGMSAIAFNRLLHDAGIQRKIGKTWLLYQKYAGLGYTLSRTYYVNDYTAAIHTYWTQRGRLFLYDRLKEYGIVPLMEAEDAASGL